MDQSQPPQPQPGGSGDDDDGMPDIAKLLSDVVGNEREKESYRRSIIMMIGIATHMMKDLHDERAKLTTPAERNLMMQSDKAGIVKAEDYMVKLEVEVCALLNVIKSDEIAMMTKQHLGWKQ